MKIKIMDTVLRDAHQSLLATRMRTEDMLPIAPLMDEIGYWSVEMWGGATFDSCLRYLKEDPWERITKLKKAMPNTRFQMLLRGQNIVGYRHYSDDIVEKFVQKAHAARDRRLPHLRRAQRRQEHAVGHEGGRNAPGRSWRRPLPTPPRRSTASTPSSRWPTG